LNTGAVADGAIASWNSAAVSVRPSSERLVIEFFNIGFEQLRAHIMLDQRFRGEIVQVPHGWRAYLRDHDFGYFSTKEAARQVVVDWFAGSGSFGSC
jgi:16S rRNA G966 N2-methylase RsmD